MIEFFTLSNTAWTYSLLAIFISYFISVTNSFGKPFSQKLRSWMQINNLYRVLRYTAFINFLLLLVSYSGLSLKDLYGVIAPSFYKPTLYRDFVIITSVCSILAYPIFNKWIRISFSYHTYRPISFRNGFFQFIISELVFVNLIYFSFYLTHLVINYTHLWFELNDMQILDWLYRSTQKSSYKMGVYFSFISALLVAFFTVNALNKIEKPVLEQDTRLKFVILSIILFFACFSGIYSIVNTVFSLRSEFSFLNWLERDQQLGVLAIRISSLILLFHLVSFILQSVVKHNFFRIVKAAIFPNYLIKDRLQFLSHKDHSTTFLSQIGFYILSISIVEASIIMEQKNLYRAILSFGLIFITDDYVIIHNYSNKIGMILRSHRYRVIIFNLLLLAGGIAMLHELRLYSFLLTYIFLSIFLFWLSRENTSPLKTI